MIHTINITAASKIWIILIAIDSGSGDGTQYIPWTFGLYSIQYSGSKNCGDQYNSCHITLDENDTIAIQAVVRHTFILLRALKE